MMDLVTQVFGVTRVSCLDKGRYLQLGLEAKPLRHSGHPNVTDDRAGGTCTWQERICLVWQTSLLYTNYVGWIFPNRFWVFKAGISVENSSTGFRLRMLHVFLVVLCHIQRHSTMSLQPVNNCAWTTLTITDLNNATHHQVTVTKSTQPDHHPFTQTSIGCRGPIQIF